jgi:glycosyltransferase involved in cell wall biosynthesis
LKFEIEKGDMWEHEILHTGDRIHEKFRNFFQENYRVYEYKKLRGIRIPRFIRPFFLRKKTDFSHDVNLFYEIQDIRLMNLFAHSAKGKNVFYDRGHSWFLNSEESGWLNKFDFFFSNSKASKVILNKRWHVPEERIKVIYNSFLPDYVEKMNRIDKKDIESLRKRYNVGNEKVVLYVGRFIALKGIHSLIEALDYLSGKDIKLLLVGDGKTKRALQNLVKMKKKEDMVIFAGMQTDTAPFYKMADVTVVPSAREPFGNVNLEAALAESPIIATKIDGIPEIIPDDRFGYLLKPKIEPSSYSYLETSSIPEYVVDPDTLELTKPKFLDPGELADTISLVLGKEPEAAKEKAGKLKERVQKEFSMEKREQRFRELVEEITQ